MCCGDWPEQSSFHAAEGAGARAVSHHGERDARILLLHPLPGSLPFRSQPRRMVELKVGSAARQGLQQRGVDSQLCPDGPERLHEAPPEAARQSQRLQRTMLQLGSWGCSSSRVAWRGSEPGRDTCVWRK